MSSYHTQSLSDADIFTVMGSVYAEVARYDSAISSGNIDQAMRAAARADEIISFSQTLNQINTAQKSEISQFSKILKERVKESKKSELDSYLMPFAVAARQSR